MPGDAFLERDIHVAMPGQIGRAIGDVLAFTVELLIDIVVDERSEVVLEGAEEPGEHRGARFRF